MNDGLGKKIIFAIVMLAVVITVIFLVSKWTGPEEDKTPGPLSEVPGETRSVTLFFVSREADGMLSETREIAVREGIEEQVKGAITALVQGPVSGEMISAIPPSVEVLQVFWHEETQTLFIDFNRALISDHPGGSAGEYYTINMIIRTLASNFPQVRRLQLLVDGYPVETIAGHYAVSKPLEIDRWR